MNKLRLLILCILTSYAAAPLAATHDLYVAGATALGSLLAFIYDLRSAQGAYKNYRSNYLKKQTEQLALPNASEENTPSQLQTRRTKPRSFTSFYTRRLVRGKQNISAVSACTGIASLLYLLFGQNTPATAHTQNLTNNQNQPDSITPSPKNSNTPDQTLQQQLPESFPPRITPHATPHIKQPCLRQNGAECGLHAVYNALLFATNAPAQEFNNKERFNTFKKKALEIIAQNEHATATEKSGNWLSSTTIDELLQHKDIESFIGDPNKLLPLCIFEPDSILLRQIGCFQNTPALVDRNALQKLLTENKKFVVLCNDQSARHYMTVHIEVDANNKLQITSADSLMNLDAYIADLVAKFTDPELKSLIDPKATAKKDLYDPATNTFNVYEPMHEGDFWDLPHTRIVDLPVLQQKRKPGGGVVQNCGIHTAYNALLLACNAPAEKFNDQDLFDRFYARAVNVAGKEETIYNNEVLKIIVDPEIQNIINPSKNTCAPCLILHSGYVLHGNQTLNSRASCDAFLAAHNTFAVSFLNQTTYSSHWITFKFKKDAEGLWTITYAEPLTGATTPNEMHQRAQDLLCHLVSGHPDFHSN